MVDKVLKSIKSKWICVRCCIYLQFKNVQEKSKEGNEDFSSRESASDKRREIKQTNEIVNIFEKYLPNSELKREHFDVSIRATVEN